MFQVSVEETFSAGHALRGYQGKCENPHGHNYRVRVTVEGQQLDSIGLLFDFSAPEAHPARLDRRRGPQIPERSGALRCHQSVGGKYGQVFLRRDVPADAARRRTRRASPASPCGRPTKHRPPIRPERSRAVHAPRLSSDRHSRRRRGHLLFRDLSQPGHAHSARRHFWGLRACLSRRCSWSGVTSGAKLRRPGA